MTSTAESSSPGATYLTKAGVRFPGTQAQATAKETAARARFAARNNLTSVSGGVVRIAASANNNPAAS